MFAVLATNCNSTMDLSNRTAKRSVQVVGEDSIRLNYINDHKLAVDAPRTAYVEPGDLQLYFDVTFGLRVAQNMGLTIQALTNDSILVCAGSRTRFGRPQAFRLDEKQLTKLSQIGRRRLCDILVGR